LIHTGEIGVGAPGISIVFMGVGRPPSLPCENASEQYARKTDSIWSIGDVPSSVILVLKKSKRGLGWFVNNDEGGTGTVWQIGTAAWKTTKITEREPSFIR
jgi:hypothetical protein